MAEDLIPQIITALTPVLVPLLIVLAKLAIAKLPKWSLPILAMVLGVLLDVLNGLVTGTTLGPMWGAILGFAGVGVREIVDQLKKAVSPPA